MHIICVNQSELLAITLLEIMFLIRTNFTFIPILSFWFQNQHYILCWDWEVVSSNLLFWNWHKSITVKKWSAENVTHVYTLGLPIAEKRNVVTPTTWDRRRNLNKLNSWIRLHFVSVFLDIINRSFKGLFLFYFFLPLYCEPIPLFARLI